MMTKYGASFKYIARLNIFQLILKYMNLSTMLFQSNKNLKTQRLLEQTFKERIDVIDIVLNN